MPKTPVRIKVNPPIGPLQRSFLDFHNKNPWVYDRLVNICYDLKRKGFQKYSMRTLIAVLRFEWDLKTHGQHVVIGGGSTKKIKLNNNHTPYYARKLIREYPQFDGFFDLRVSEAG